MPEQLKNIYSQEYLTKLAEEIKSAYPSFKAKDFVTSIMDDSWESLELKGRMRQITINLGKYLPKEYTKALEVIDNVIKNYGTWLDGYSLFFPDFVELYGHEEVYWDISMAALERYTLHASAEFAVRPFIINHEEKMMAQMQTWSRHKHEDVRRLASEGCRPMLPWAQSLPKFKKDPTPILPILEQLKADPALFVRKSVANNLNDISKTHPDLVAKLAKDWYGQNELTNWIVKHGCRTLLKKGNKDVLAIFGYNNADVVEVSDFAIDTTTVAIGGEINISFAILANQATKVRLEYGLDYVKASGKPSRKIFQISELSLPQNQKKQYTKKHAFADLSTRKHYPGTHSVTLIVNGTEQGTLDFELTN